MTTISKPWGSYDNILDEEYTKVKKIIIKPNQSPSYQYHFKRSEIWFVSEGKCCVNFHKNDHSKIDEIPLNTFDTFSVKKEEWQTYLGTSTEQEFIENKNWWDIALIKRVPKKDKK